MLYAKEDRINNKLMFACRTCQYSEEATSACVFRNSIYNIIGETAGVTQDVGSDPTVGLPDLCCTLCGQPFTCDICGGVDEYGEDFVQSSDGRDEEEEDDEEEEEEEEDSMATVEGSSGEQKAQDRKQSGGAKSSRIFC